MGIIPWTIKYSCITFASIAVAMVLCCNFTTWGKQFWLINKQLLLSSFGVKCLFYSAVIVPILILVTRLGIVGNILLNRAINAMEFHAESMFWSALISSLILVGIGAITTYMLFMVEQSLIIAWRKKLTEYLQSIWFNNNNYYLFNFLAEPVDNPDQRIDVDSADFAEKTVTLADTIISSLFVIVQSVQILWYISAPITIGKFIIFKAVLTFTIVYLFLAVLGTIFIGRPLIKLNYTQKIFEANYRFSLARIRMDNKEIALQGTDSEHISLLENKFGHVIHNVLRIIRRRAFLQLYNNIPRTSAQLFAYVLQAHAFFSHRLLLGDVFQSGNMVTLITDKTYKMQKSYDDFTEYRSTLRRLSEFIIATGQTHEIVTIEPQTIEGGIVCRNMTITTPDQRVLVADLNMNVRPGESVLITGMSGIGKSSTILTLASLWPYASGEIALPHRKSCYFIPQKSFLPEGKLRDVLTATPGNLPTKTSLAQQQRVSDQKIMDIMTKLNLSELNDLDQECDWSSQLSPGQIQRLSIVKAILAKPKALFLDESTSALDEKLEEKVYELIKAELPYSTVITVGHRSVLRKFHTTFLQLRADGKWAFLTAKQDNGSAPLVTPHYLCC